MFKTHLQRKKISSGNKFNSRLSHNIKLIWMVAYLRMNFTSISFLKCKQGLMVVFLQMEIKLEMCRYQWLHKCRWPRNLFMKRILALLMKSLKRSKLSNMKNILIQKQFVTWKPWRLKKKIFGKIQLIQS
jgi:hypothetical protein